MLTWILLLWLAAMGGTIGSFLNVVVYRLPAGKSLVYPGSHCPACGHAIRWYDNVPVFGWLLLGGRCRDCGGRISIRYPLVEALTAAVFLLLGAVELLGGGANLPLRPVEVIDATIHLPWTPERLAGILAYHLLLLSTLLPAALIEYDAKPVPWRLTWPGLAVGLMAPVLWPFLHPVPAGPAWSGWFAGLVDGTAGLAAGLVLGLVIERISGKNAGGLAVGPTCTGLFLGWQAVAVLWALAVAIHLVFRGLGRWTPRAGRLPFHGWLALSTLVWILAWRPLVELLPAICP